MARRGRRDADELLAAELASGKTVRDAAAAVEIGERTAFRRLEDPEFRRRVTELRAGLVRDAAGKLAANMGQAADKLAELIGNADPDVALKAAVKVIELSMKAVQLTELEGRLADLEERLGEREP